MLRHYTNSRFMKRRLTVLWTRLTVLMVNQILLLYIVGLTEMLQHILTFTYDWLLLRYHQVVPIVSTQWWWIKWLNHSVLATLLLHLPWLDFNHWRGSVSSFYLDTLLLTHVTRANPWGLTAVVIWLRFWILNWIIKRWQHFDLWLMRLNLKLVDSCV